MPSTTIRKTEHLAPRLWAVRGADRHLTFAGMAFFAGTGPGDQCCGRAAVIGPGTATRQKAPCGKFKAITSRNGREVPRSARACRYFLPCERA